MVEALWRTLWKFLRELKIELPYDPATPLVGIYPDKTIIQKYICTPVFTEALFTTARIRNIHRQMNRTRRYGIGILWCCCG